MKNGQHFSFGTSFATPVVVALLAVLPSFAQQPSGAVSFSIADRGGLSRISSAMPSTSQTGYAAIQPNAGNASPSGIAIFGLRQNGILVSEASVPASLLMQSGRIYAEVDGPVNTGIAIANPNSQAATISFFFTDANGNFGSGSTSIPAGGQIASFLNQAPYNARSPLNGTFTFNSSVPVAVVALRGLTNERGDFLMTTLPVTDLSRALQTGTVIFPHFASGGGWATQIALINPSDIVVSGRVQFLDQTGNPALVTIGGQSNSTFSYSVAPRSSQKLRVAGSSVSTLSGSVRVIPSGNDSAPSGLAIFAYRSGGITVTEAGVPAVPSGNGFRLYTESSGTFLAIGSTQTGLAVANTAAGATTVKLELYNFDGSSTGFTTSVSIPGNGQVSVFLDDIAEFRSIQKPFQGMLRVSSAAPIAVIGLRGRVNERENFLITSLPPTNEVTSTSTSRVYFPHIVDGGGYTTQFILFSGQVGQASSGTMQFFSQSGTQLELGANPKRSPQVFSIAPLSAPPGATITISGINFVAEKTLQSTGRNSIIFTLPSGIGIPITPVTASNTTLTVIVPPLVDANSPDWYKGPMTVCVNVDGERSCNSQMLNVMEAMKPTLPRGQTIVATGNRLMERAAATFDNMGNAAAARELRSQAQVDLAQLKAMIDDALAGKPRQFTFTDLTGQLRTAAFDTSVVDQIESLLSADQMSSQSNVLPAADNVIGPSYCTLPDEREKEKVSDAYDRIEFDQGRQDKFFGAMSIAAPIIACVGAALAAAAPTAGLGAGPACLAAGEKAYVVVQGTLFVAKTLFFMNHFRSKLKIESGPNFLSAIEVKPNPVRVSLNSATNFQVLGHFKSAKAQAPKALAEQAASSFIEMETKSISKIPGFSQVESIAETFIGKITTYLAEDFLGTMIHELAGAKPTQEENTIELSQRSVSPPELHDVAADVTLACDALSQPSKVTGKATPIIGPLQVALSANQKNLLFLDLVGLPSGHLPPVHPSTTLVLQAGYRGVEISPTSPSVTVGSTITLTAVLKDLDNKPISTATFTWSSSDQTVATVSNSGVVTGLKEGKTQIAATESNSGQRATTMVVVLAKDITSIHVVGTGSFTVPSSSRGKVVQTISIDATIKLPGVSYRNGALVASCNQFNQCEIGTLSGTFTGEETSQLCCATPRAAATVQDRPIQLSSVNVGLRGGYPIPTYPPAWFLYTESRSGYPTISLELSKAVPHKILRRLPKSHRQKFVSFYAAMRRSSNKVNMSWRMVS